MQISAGVYVHYPYCLAKCPYCDFVSYGTPAGTRTAADDTRYADAVLAELRERAPAFGGRTIDSVFFGGGTPSLWQPRELGRVLAGVREQLGVHADVEVTVECNPSSLDEDKARGLVDVGVNRLSVGVQSLDDERLRFLGRLHDARGALEAIEGAKRAGVPRISGDLIFGVAGQTVEQARAEAGALADRGLGHVSAYQLTIEPGTRFGELSRRGRLPLADDGLVADSFLAVDEALRERGFGHYEISNYARPGEEARHNLGYWRGYEYLGLGCGAYGFSRHDGARGGVRWRNAVDPERYQSEGVRAEQEREALAAEALLRERIMLGLRVSEGVDLDDAARDLGIEGGGWTPERTRTAASLSARGRLLREGARARIPRQAWLWADDTAARLF